MFMDFKKTQFVKRLARAVIQIENAIVRFLSKKKMVKGLVWRRRIKQSFMAVVVAWRTRKALNCLTF